MKKDSALKLPEHPALTEEKLHKVTFSLSKAGGVHELPLGARLVVPEGVFSKKNSITCSVVPPSERWRHTPSFPGQHLTSEIFMLSGPASLKQANLILILPYYPPEAKHVELNVKGMWKDECTWVDVGFIPKAISKLPSVELEIDRLGTFAVTFRQETEQFSMTPNGGLYHCRLSRNVTIRMPKKAVDTTINYSMRIEAIPEERVAFCKEFFTQDCADLMNVSEIIDLDPDTRCDFRRLATIKLPLPQGVEVEGEASDEIVVLQKEAGSWQWVDAKYKFTRSTVSFDIKNPGRLCVVKTRPDRQKKMQAAVGVLEERSNRELGQVNVFLSLKEKSWMGMVECFPLAVAPAKILARQEQGFTVVHKVWVAQDVGQKTSFSRRPPPPREFRAKQPESFEVYDGLTWTIEMEDDLQFGPDTDLVDNADLCCFRYLKESYRRFNLVPSTEEERDLRGVLVLRPTGVLDPKLKEQLTLSFHVDVLEEAVTKYHYVPPPEPEPEPKPKPKLDLPSLLAPEQPPPPVRKMPLPKARTFSVSALDRLTQPTKRASIPDKEAKVISGKSLMALSKVVNEGLTLAVHLDLPDSTITGIGFDALSNNRSMSEVAYRILLYWKRTRKDKRDGAVQHLVRGLRSMGKHGVADVVLERHSENKELTMDCFLMAAVAGVNIHS